MQFLVSEVKPFIDRTYRAIADRENTAGDGLLYGRPDFSVLDLEIPGRFF